MSTVFTPSSAPTLVGIVLYIAVLSVYPYMAKKRITSFGERLVTLPTNKGGGTKLFYLTLIVCFAVIVLPALNTLGTVGDVVLVAVGVLGSYCAMRSKLTTSLAGLYKRGIVEGETILKIDDIDSIVSSAKDESALELEAGIYPLDLRLKDKGSVTLTFNTATDRELFKAGLRDLLA